MDGFHCSWQTIIVIIGIIIIILLAIGNVMRPSLTSAEAEYYNA